MYMLKGKGKQNVYRWVVVKQLHIFLYHWQSPTPAPYIKEMVDAAQFYMNRVLKDFKGK